MPFNAIRENPEKGQVFPCLQSITVTIPRAAVKVAFALFRKFSLHGATEARIHPVSEERFSDLHFYSWDFWVILLECTLSLNNEGGCNDAGTSSNRP